MGLLVHNEVALTEADLTPRAGTIGTKASECDRAFMVKAPWFSSVGPANVDEIVAHKERMAPGLPRRLSMGCLRKWA